MIARVYLDHNATTPARSQAVAAFMAAAEQPLNPSSVHAEGRRARSLLDDARRRVASLADAAPEAVTFTSGATEAINLALRPGMTRGSDAIGRLIVSATEHAAVLGGHGYASDAAEVVSVAQNGVIDLDRLRILLARGPRALVALQAANNETGVLQPLHEAAAMARSHGGVVFCDAVQAVGRLPCDRASLPADLLALSGHKLGGLPGAGALIVRASDLRLPSPLIRGGGQENGLRAGTENVPALAALGAAAIAVAAADDGARLRALRDAFEADLLRIAPSTVVFGVDAPRLPNTSCFAVPGVAAEMLMMAFDLGGVAVSSGSACASGKVGRSHVLEAMGAGPDLRRGAIRVSFGWPSTEGDVDVAVRVLDAALGRRMSRRPSRAA